MIWACKKVRLHPGDAQVRVMPRCWFVLLRFWLRVDHVLVRLYETRYLCDFRCAARVVSSCVTMSESFILCTVQLPHCLRMAACSTVCEDAWASIGWWVA